MYNSLQQDFYFSFTQYLSSKNLKIIVLQKYIFFKVTTTEETRVAGQELRSGARNGGSGDSRHSGPAASRLRLVPWRLFSYQIARRPCLHFQLQAFQDKDLPLVSFASFNQFFFFNLSSNFSPKNRKVAINQRP